METTLLLKDKKDNPAKLSNERAKLRSALQDNIFERCKTCRFFDSPTQCKIIEGPVGSNAVCDWIQSRGVKAAKNYSISDENWIPFVKGMIQSQPYQHKVIDGANTPEGQLVLIEDTAKPPHRFSLDKSFHVEHTSLEHHWTQKEVDDLIKLGKKSSKELSYDQPAPSWKTDVVETVKDSELILDDVLKGFKGDFMIAEDFVTMVGGLCNHKKTKGDIDIVVNLDSEELMRRIGFRIERTLSKLNIDERRLHMLNDKGPFSSHVHLFDLVLVRKPELKLHEMSKTELSDSLDTIKPFKKEESIFVKVVEVDFIEGSKSRSYLTAIEKDTPVGKTFNTNIKAEKGDKLEIDFVNLNQYTDPKTEKLWFNFWSPRVIAKTNKLTSIEEAKNLTRKTSGQVEDKPFPKIFKKLMLLDDELHDFEGEIDNFEQMCLQDATDELDIALNYRWISELRFIPDKVLSGELRNDDGFIQRISQGKMSMLMLRDKDNAIIDKKFTEAL